MSTEMEKLGAAFFGAANGVTLNELEEAAGFSEVLDEKQSVMKMAGVLHCALQTAGEGESAAAFLFEKIASDSSIPEEASGALVGAALEILADAEQAGVKTAKAYLGHMAGAFASLTPSVVEAIVLLSAAGGAGAGAGYWAMKQRVANGSDSEVENLRRMADKYESRTGKLERKLIRKGILRPTAQEEDGDV